MSPNRLAPLIALFMQPFLDVLRGIDRSVNRRLALPLMLLAMAGSWWLYVPLHELFHAWGCLTAGGTVSRLEIDEAYGAVWLARLFPYVVPGSEYAGRLSGFDTGGRDMVYLATVFFPYLLTIFIGVPMLRLASRRGSAALLGAAFPWALTPFLSLSGDYYEMGSIVVSRAVEPWLPEALTRWRGDDLPLLVETLFGGVGTGSGVDAAGLSAGFILGLVGAFLTYRAGAFLTYRAGAWLATRLIGNPHARHAG